MLAERRHQNFFNDFFSARSAFREMVESKGGRLDVLPVAAGR